MLLFMTRDPGGFVEIFSFKNLDTEDYQILSRVDGQSKWDLDSDIGFDEWEKVSSLITDRGTRVFSDSTGQAVSVEAQYAGQYIAFMQATM